MIKTFVLMLALMSVALSAQAQAPLTAELVPETVRIGAGQPFTVAVKLTHVEHGHSYWKNPGGPGYGTKFKWTLPEGFTAAEPLWPAPRVIPFDSFITYSYEGTVAALVEITPPATVKVGEVVSLELFVNALVCTKVCAPVKTTVTTTVTVADDVGAKNPLVQQAREALPAAAKNWTFTAAKTATGAAVTLKPGAGANTDLRKAYFFSEMPVIDSQKPQQFEKAGDGWVLNLPGSADESLGGELKGVLVAEDGWLADDAKTTAFDVTLPLGQSAPVASTAVVPPTQPYSPATLLLFAFIGGLILNVMPCVFPVLGIKIMGFVQQAGEDRRKIFLHGLAYTLGVLVCFWALALLVITLGKGWGAQLQSPLFVLGLCYFFMAFGLNMAGLFEIGTSAIGVGQELQTKGGLQGSFFSGLLATVVATPCSAPFLGPALAYALSLPVMLALGVFTVIGLGLSSPYLILSLAPKLVKMLPRPGAWMESFKQGMSFLLFATVGYMLWTLGGLVSEWQLLMTIFGLVLVSLACWIYGRWCLPHKSVKARRYGLIFSVMALGAGLYLGYPPAKLPTDLVWQPWSPELVKELRDAGKPVYIDFTARWCATCQVNKRVYKNADLAKLIKDKGVVLLKADWTDYDERITAVLRDEYGKAAVPVNVYYAPKAEKAQILPELLTVDNVSTVLRH